MKYLSIYWNEVAQNLVQIFMIPRARITLTLVVPLAATLTMTCTVYKDGGQVSTSSYLTSFGARACAGGIGGSGRVIKVPPIQLPDLVTSTDIAVDHDLKPLIIASNQTS